MARASTGSSATTGGLGAVAAAAVAATVAGHELAYRLSYFGGHARTRALANTGHAYWPGAVRAAIVLAIVGLILQIVRGRMAARHAAPRALSLFGRLAPIQLALFVCMEIAERVVEHESPQSLFTQRAFWIGVPAQLVVAIVVAILLRVARRAGQVLGLLLSDPPVGDRTQTWWCPEERVLSSGSDASSWRTRAPPLAAVVI
ncbi:MAG: hypothetical protein ABR579_10845 [Actinomycetota bacterium]